MVAALWCLVVDSLFFFYVSFLVVSCLLFGVGRRLLVAVDCLRLDVCCLLLSPICWSLMKFVVLCRWFAVVWLLLVVCG